MEATVQERLVSALGTALIVLLFGYALLMGLTVRYRATGERPLALLDLATPPPPPAPKPHVLDHPKTARASGKASPRNLRNKATDIVRLPPVVPLPVPPPVVTAPKVGTGMAAQTGASDRPGPGQGAGGEGNGTGSGGEGDGDGDGEVPPRPIKDHLKFADLPADLRAAGLAGTGPTHYAASVRYSVEIDGRVNQCVVTGSSGNAELDGAICPLIRQRFRYKPARDDGEPVRSFIETNESWYMDKSPDSDAQH